MVPVVISKPAGPYTMSQVLISSGDAQVTMAEEDMMLETVIIWGSKQSGA